MEIAYYQAPIQAFVVTGQETILGELVRAHVFAVEHQQRNAWLRQISLMKQAVAQIKTGHIFFEFAIPRMGKRADVVLVIGDVILVLEFKVGATTFDRSAVEQGDEYVGHRQSYRAVAADRAQDQGRPGKRTPGRGALVQQLGSFWTNGWSGGGRGSRRGHPSADLGQGFAEAQAFLAEAQAFRDAGQR